MENVNLFKKELFDKLKLATIFEDAVPMTVQGINFQKHVIQSLKNGKTFSLSFIDSIVRECARVASIDEAIKDIHQTVTETLNESLFKYNIALLSEVIDNGLSKDTVQEMLVKECNALITESEDVVLKKIQNGVFAVYETSNSAAKAISMHAKSLIKMNQHGQITEGDFKVYNPASYYIVENDSIYFRAKNHIFAMDKNGLRLAAAPNKSFVEMSMLVENTEFLAEDDCFKLQSKSFGEIAIREGKIFKKNAETFVFEEISMEDFAKQSSMVIESRLSNAFERSAANAMAREADGVIALASNFKRIIKLDKVKIFESVNESFIFCSNNGRHSAGVLSSNRKPKQFLSYGKLKDAIQYIKEETGCDLTDEYKDELKVENEQDYNKSIQIKEQSRLIGSLNAKLKEINEELKLVEEGSEAHTLLHKANATVKGMIIAENNELDKMLKALSSSVNESKDNSVIDDIFFAWDDCCDDDRKGIEHGMTSGGKHQFDFDLKKMPKPAIAEFSKTLTEILKKEKAHLIEGSVESGVIKFKL